MIMITLKPPKTLGKPRKSQTHTKHAHAVTRTTPEICQAPVPSRPGIKYPVRGNPSLRREHEVSAPARVCETWLSREWSSSGGLYTTAAVEEALGERLRLNQYRQEFTTDDSAKVLSQVLSESQPPSEL